MIIALLSFLAAIAIGAYRQMCNVYFVQLPYNCPSSWRSPLFRFVTWIISTSLSVTYAFILATWIVEEVNVLLGQFSFGVFLSLRWLISVLVGAGPAMRHAEAVLRGTD